MRCQWIPISPNEWNVLNGIQWCFFFFVFKYHKQDLVPGSHDGHGTGPISLCWFSKYDKKKGFPVLICFRHGLFNWFSCLVVLTCFTILYRWNHMTYIKSVNCETKTDSFSISYQTIYTVLILGIVSIFNLDFLFWISI